MRTYEEMIELLSDLVKTGISKNIYSKDELDKFESVMIDFYAFESMKEEL